jgi:hypothetical protein
MSRHLGAKAAFKYTYTWDRTFGELVGMYPKFKPSNVQRYKRGSLFFKALMREMKVKNIRKIYRGVSTTDANNIMKDLVIDRNTFTSFSRDIEVAKRFAGDSRVIMCVQGTIPCVDYSTNMRYRSLFPEESEVLLPPGTFEQDYGRAFNNINSVPGYTIINFTFTPKRIDVNALARNANKKFVYSHTNNKKNFNNTNNRWNQEKLKVLLVNQNKKFENLKKLKSMNQTKDAVKRAKSRLLNLINKDKQRIDFFKQRFAQHKRRRMNLNVN